ncbi:MAG: EAL domain-containing protein [Burkholderiales bacterium]|nr:EAL domain-containing protein [Burkholderiales bacterium]
MFKLLTKFHSRVTRLLLHFNIGVRLLALIGLAASVAVALASVGIFGLAASKESLRSVYEDRMAPVQQLSEIAKLMLSNRLLLQAALSEVGFGEGGARPAELVMNGPLALQTADAIEKNIATIGGLWRIYRSSALAPAERRLADRFALSRGVFVSQALQPAVAALRAGNYAEAKALATRARTLYEKAAPDLQALNQLQFDAAHQAYSDGVRRYENTYAIALGALSAAILVMSWLGLVLTMSIVKPLKLAIAIFKKIANGQYDTTIAIEGRDEISKVMLAVREMQARLGEDEVAIHQLAFYDPLTKLPNRRLLRDRLQRALSLSTRNHMFGAVLMIDLDNFKSINDTRGHHVGDLLLAEVALRIQACVRQSDTVARLGGDEFIVMLVDLSPDEVVAALLAEEIGEKILAVIAQPFMLENKRHHSSGSMGLCLFMGQNASIDDLLKRADISMYQAKNSGRNAFRFYDPHIQASLETRIALESELRNAMAGKQLKLYYQIQIDKLAGALGAEVLLRWEHPVQGMVLPDQFIPIAEESGLILAIGEWVLRSACEQLRSWAGNPATEKFLLSVNVSASQFRQADFVAVVSRILSQTGVNPARLKLELTESMVLHNVVDTIDKMKALNRLGISFSMDDFGTGNSSLSQLTNLPIQQLKIDRSFVRNIPDNHSDAVIVQTIIGMACNLGLAVIAEGVETEQQRDCLERFGCPTYQGYLYGKPMPLHEFEILATQLIAV